jgi:hypothetical protein
MQTYLLLKTMPCEHRVELVRESGACVRLRYLGNIEKEGEKMTVMVKVNRPRYEGSMIWRGPSIGSEVHMAGVFLEDLINAFAAALEHRLDVTSDSGWRWNVGGGAAGLHECDEPRVGSDSGRTGTFNTPEDNMSLHFF